MNPPISYWKKPNYNRNKKWASKEDSSPFSGNARYGTLRTGLKDKMLSVAEQTEASKKVLDLVAQCGYSLTQVNGQRIFGPPLDWTGPAPGAKCEIFVGKVPRMLYEHDIYPVFSCIGKIYEIRLMMDFSGMNRGYCFIMYTNQEDAIRAVKELDHFEIRPGRRIGVVASINYCRLCVNQIPYDITAEEVVKRIYEMTGNVEKVAVYRNTTGSLHYALISYKTHRGAAMARRLLVPESTALFPGGKVNVEWAHPNFNPTNVLEECGTCDDAGNIIMKKVVISTKPKKTTIRRITRKNGQCVPTCTKTPEPIKEIAGCKNLLTNFDQSTVSLNTLAYDQPNHHDQRAIKKDDQYNNHQMSSTQDPIRRNNLVDNVDRKQEAQDIIPKLYDSNNFQKDENNPLNNSIPAYSETNSFRSNINSLAASFEQQDSQLSSTSTYHIDRTSIPISNPSLSNQIHFDELAQREITLKVQAKALFQPNNEPWKNYSPQLNPSFQPTNPLQPNCTLANGVPSQNVPFYYNAYKSQFAASTTYPAQSLQELNNVQDFNQCRLVVTNSLQKVWDIITKMPSQDQYRACLEFNRLNQRAGKFLASFGNHAPPSPPPYYCQAPCHFSLGYAASEDFFTKSKVPLVKCPKERSCTPRPILSRTRVDGNYN